MQDPTLERQTCVQVHCMRRAQTKSKISSDQTDARIGSDGATGVFSYLRRHVAPEHVASSSASLAPSVSPREAETCSSGKDLGMNTFAMFFWLLFSSNDASFSPDTPTKT